LNQREPAATNLRAQIARIPANLGLAWELQPDRFRIVTNATFGLGLRPEATKLKPSCWLMSQSTLMGNFDEKTSA
jgi:hypothetical protein